MRTITVRDVPDPVYMRLKRLALASRRSLQQQILVILEGVPAEPADDLLRRASAIRRRLQGRTLGDVVLDLRSERER
jgi:hypothetical protein